MTRRALFSLILLVSVNAAGQTTIVLPDVQKPYQIVVERNDLYEDRIYVSDTQKGFHIAVFDLEGRHLRTIDLSRDVEQVGNSPLMHQYGVSNGRIYATTYKKVDGKTEMLVLDLEGRILRRIYLPLTSIRPTRGVLRYDPFCVDGERLYELVENKETEKWELVITDLRQAG